MAEIPAINVNISTDLAGVAPNDGQPPGRVATVMPRNETVAFRGAGGFRSPRPRKTVLFSLLDIRDMPPPEQLQLARIYEENRRWWPKLGEADGKMVIDLAAVRRHAATMDDTIPLSIDFEDVFDPKIGKVRELRMDARDWTLTDIQTDGDVARAILQAYRDGGYTGAAGFYGLMPCTEVNWNILRRHPDRSRHIVNWWAANKVHEGPGGLANDVQIIYCQLYASGPDASQWVDWAAPTIEAAKAYGKRVVAYISPCAHWKATGGFARAPLSERYIETQLDLIRDMQVDAALWLGRDGNFSWNWNQRECIAFWEVVRDRIQKWTNA